MAEASEIQQAANTPDPVGQKPGTPDPAAQLPPSDPGPESFTMEDWKKIVPEEFLQMQDVKDAKTPKDLFNNYAYYRNKVGKSIAIPTDESSDEERADFLGKLRTGVPQLLDMPDADDAEGLANLYGRLGRPEDISGYDAPQFELEDGVKMNEDQINGFRSIALKHNLTQAQFKGVLQDYLGGGLEAANAGQVAFNKEMEGLKKDWGEAYQHKVDQSLAIAKEFFPNTGLAKMIENGTVGAGSLKDLNALVTQLGAEGQQLVGDVNSEGANTPAELRDQASALLTKITTMNPGAERQRAIEKRIKLLQAASRNS